MIPSEFLRDLLHHKTRVTGLSCGVVCVIVRLAVFAEHRFVTDGRTAGRTDGQRDGHSMRAKYPSSIASRVSIFGAVYLFIFILVAHLPHVSAVDWRSWSCLPPMNGLAELIFVVIVC